MRILRQNLLQHTKTYLSTALAVLVMTAVFVTSAQPAQAEVQVVTQNFTNDTQGNYAPLNFYDGTYGPGNSTAGIHVPLSIPNPTGTDKPITVAGISIQMHDHDESLEYILDVYNKGTLVQRVVNLADIATGGSDASCGQSGGFVQRWHDHHLPQNANQDASCMQAHTHQINQVSDGLLLTFHCRTDYCRNNPEVHAHIGSITWWIDVPEDDPEPIPAPRLETLGCVNEASALYSTDLLRVSWDTPPVPIVDVAITDSTASNPWNGTNARYWNKKTPGVTSTTGPSGFIPRTANTSTLLFQPNKTYRVVLWDGTRLSEERTVRFEACPETPKPATASLAAQCVDRAVGEPLVFNFAVSNVNLQNQQFKKAEYYLRIPNSSATSALRNYLGRPNWTDRDGSYAYLLSSSSTPPNGNLLQYRWTTGRIGSIGNGRTLADLEAWYAARGETGTVQVAVGITTTANGADVPSIPAATAQVSISPTACVSGGGGNPGEPICVPNCGTAACSLEGSDNGCGGQCEAGTGIGQPNPVQILAPQANAPISLDSNNQFDISWRQQPTNNAAASLVSEYAIVVYKPENYATPDSAFKAAELGATDAVSFTQRAAQQRPANIYVQEVTLSGRLLEGPLTIAIQSRNLQCPAYNQTQQSSWVGGPHPLSAEVAGTFYVIPPGGTCSPAAGTPITLPSAQVSATALDGTPYSGNFSGQNNFSFSVPADPTSYSYQLSFSEGTGQLRCASCNAGGGPTSCTRGNTAGPADNAHFYLTRFDTSKGPWWQTWGGLIYGHTGVRSNTPGYSEYCPDGSLTCKPFLSRALGNAAESSGIALTNGLFSGTMTSGWWNEFSGTQPRVTGTNNKDFVTKENYSFFVDRLQASLPTSMGPRIASVDDVAAMPTEAYGSDAMVSYRDGNLTLELGSSSTNVFTVTSGQKRVIFVNGDLTIVQTGEEPVTQVEQGGFLAFIVKGNITFDRSVGINNPGTGDEIVDVQPMVEGVFIADKTISVASAGSSDRKFVGAGTFVGWEGVNLSRTFANSDVGATTHQSTPTETIIFRPDFLINVPDILMYYDLVWQEIR